METSAPDGSGQPATTLPYSKIQRPAPPVAGYYPQQASAASRPLPDYTPGRSLHPGSPAFIGMPDSLWIVNIDRPMPLPRNVLFTLLLDRKPCHCRTVRSKTAPTPAPSQELDLLTMMHPAENTEHLASTC